MHLDELADAIAAVSDDAVIQQLATLLRAWKTDDTTVEQLRRSVERFIGNTWIESDAEHQRVHGLWSAFRTDAIESIAGMTMNERLYCFDLFARFEACDSEESRLRVYTKLLASP